MKTQKNHIWISAEEAKEQIRRNSPERDYDVHHEIVTLENGEKALKRVCTPKAPKQ